MGSVCSAATCTKVNWSVWSSENSDRTRISTIKAHPDFDMIEVLHAGQGKIRVLSSTGSDVKQI